MSNKMIADLDEMTSRFQGSYITAVSKDGERKIPFKVYKFVKSERGIFVKSEGDIYPIKDICLDRPTLGVFNVGKFVYYVTIKPRRQWKRGLVYDHLMISDRFEYEARITGHNRLTRNSLLEAIYNPEYPSFEDAFKSVKSLKTIAKAFSPRFYFGIKADSNNILLFYKKWIVGWIDDSSGSIMLKSHHLFEELSQFAKVEKV